MENKELAKGLTSDIFSTLVLGTKVFVGSVLARNKPFVFSQDQAAFLISLHQLKNISAAAIAIGKDDEWAKKFFQSKKFVTFRNLKLDEAKVKAGITTEYLMLLAKWNLEGKKVWWDAECTACHYKDEWMEHQVEMCRNDDMVLEPTCAYCYEKVELTPREQPFTMNREQMDHWKEIASRLWPKVDRVQHQFASEEIEFETR